jgi:hypothetical protein
MKIQPFVSAKNTLGLPDREFNVTKQFIIENQLE